MLHVPLLSVKDMHGNNVLDQQVKLSDIMEDTGHLAQWMMSCNLQINNTNLLNEGCYILKTNEDSTSPDSVLLPSIKQI